jgi:ectoine hydroxylase-related dioxygenase (phytanoyl-CoA dioxygenase family)
MEKMDKLFRASFETDGYLHVPGALRPSRVAAVTQAVQEIFDAHRTSRHSHDLVLSNILRADRQTAASSKGEFSFQVEHAFRHSEELRTLALCEDIRAMLRLVDDRPALLFDDQCYFKPERCGGPTYLHRDSDFFGQLAVTTIWIPLTPAREESGCLYFVPGSHRKQDTELRVRRRTEAPRGDPNTDRELDFFYEFDPQTLHAVPLRCDPCDAVIIHRNVLHASMSNSSNQPRYSYLMEFLPEDDVSRYRAVHPGVFEYHGRLANMVPLG